jgi:adenosylcobinamide-GDP ribazoletransferase
MRAPDRASPIRGLVAATTFLTRLPVGQRAGRVTEGDLRASPGWFPAVGTALGVVGATAGWLVAHRAPSTLAAAIVVALDTVATGALHLDGLADTADGLGAASTGRDGLRVMRDPAVGAFGVIAIALDLALRIGATGALLVGPAFPWGIVAAAATARCAPIGLARALPYLRPEGGSASWVGEGPSMAAILWGVATAVSVSTLAGFAGWGAVVGTTIVVTAVVGRIARRSLGGATGDVFGAATELAQTLSLVAVVIVTG